MAFTGPADEARWLLAEWEEARERVSNDAEFEVALAMADFIRRTFIKDTEEPRN